MIIMCNKLYKKSLFENIRFPIGKTHEDEFVAYKLFHKSPKTVYIDLKMYFYLQREGSITGRKFNASRFDKIDALIERGIFFKKQGLIDLYNKSVNLTLYNIMNHYEYLKKEKTTSENKFYLRKLKKFYNYIYKKIFEQKKFKL
jgi:hypothetical protein